MSNSMFTIYSKKGCSYCDQIKELMILTNQRFVVYTLGEQFSIQQFEDEFGTTTFPQVVHDVNGDRVRVGGTAETAQYFKEQQLA